MEKQKKKTKMTPCLQEKKDKKHTHLYQISKYNQIHETCFSHKTEETLKCCLSEKKNKVNKNKQIKRKHTTLQEQPWLLQLAM